MNSKDYVIDALNNFVQMYREARVRYEYDEFALAHFVEVTPKNLFDSEEFHQWEDDTFDAFVSEYPNENICFVSDEALCGVENPCYDSMVSEPITQTQQREPLALGDLWNGIPVVGVVPFISYNMMCTDGRQLELTSVSNNFNLLGTDTVREMATAA